MHIQTSDLAEALHYRVSCLHELHTLSQTQSLLLDEADYTGFVLLGEAKEELIKSIAAVDGNVDKILKLPGALEGIADCDLASHRSLARDAARLMASIVSIDRTNQKRLEQIKADVFRLLQATQHERHLRKTYEAWAIQ